MSINNLSVPIISLNSDRIFTNNTEESVHINKNIKMSSFKSSKNIQKKEGGPGRSVSDNQSSSVTLNKLAIKARKPYYTFELQQ